MRSRAILAVGIALAVGATACSSGLSDRPVDRVSPTAGATEGGDAAPPVEVERRTLFVQDNLAPLDVRPGSEALARAVEGLGLGTEGLEVESLETTPDASGVFLYEDGTDAAWGSLLSQGQPAVFRSFHDEPALGQWLILVTDVVVYRLEDPIPPTAYRWDRAAVDAYAACGMPADPADSCRQEFFRAADTVVLKFSGAPGRGQ